MSSRIFHFEEYDAMPCSITESALEIARADLLALGLTDEQIGTVTGFGLASPGMCKREDTILHKYACGALSRFGVMGVIFGSDSPQHHRGTAL